MGVTVAEQATQAATDRMRAAGKDALHIVVYTQYFPPETGAPQARLYELALRLQRHGHRLTILTGLPSYPEGRIFDGYRGRFWRVESLSGLRVIRAPLLPSRSARAIPRMANYLSFAASSLAIGAVTVGRADLLVFESPPLFLVPSALLLGRLLRARIVMNVSDIWPDILVRMGSLRSGPVLDTMLWLERLGYRRSDAVAVTNPGALRQIRERFPGITTTLISNGVDTRLFHPELRSHSLRQELGAEDHTVLVVYCGLLGIAQGLDAVLDAADRLRVRPKIRFVMIGDGPERERLSRRAAQLRLPNLRLFPRRPKEAIAGVLASSDIGLVPLVARLPGTMPSKIYETLASGLPAVVAAGCEGEALVRDAGVGSAYDPMDGNSLAEAIQSLAANGGISAGVRARCRAVAERFDRDVIAARTDAMLRAVSRGARLPVMNW